MSIHDRLGLLQSLLLMGCGCGSRSHVVSLLLMLLQQHPGRRGGAHRGHRLLLLLLLLHHHLLLLLVNGTLLRYLVDHIGDLICLV